MKLAKSVFKGVELVKVGDWRAGTGKATITREHLAAMVAAATDPEVDASPIKLGHVGGFALGDSLPAAGWVTNPRLSADGNSLIGDLSDVPTKLANIIPTAYKRRSVEMDLNVSTPSGKKYAAALTGLALLGAQAPAVKGLADVLSIYASEQDHDPDTTHTSTLDVLIEESDTPTIPHDETGNSEPTGDGPTGQQTTSKEGEASMAFIDKLREKLGLPETATEDEVLAAANKAEEKPNGEPKTDEQKAAEQKAADDAKAKETAGDNTGEPKPVEQEKVAASAGDRDTVTVSKVQFSEMQIRLGALEKTDTERRHDGVVSIALSQGRISPAEEKTWRERLGKSEDTTTEIMLSLAPRFNTIELGADHAPHTDTAEDVDTIAKQWTDQLGMN